MYAYTADGRILNNIYSVLPLNLDDATFARFMNSALPMKQTLDIPAGLVYVRAGVLDPATAHTGAVEFPMTIEMKNAGPEHSSTPVAANLRDARGVPDHLVFESSLTCRGCGN